MSFDLLDLLDLTTLFSSVASYNRGTHVIGGSSVTFWSDDLLQTIIFSQGQTVPQKTTFEFDFTPIDLPENLKSGRYFFAEISDAADNKAAVLFSKTEISITDSETNHTIRQPFSFDLNTRYTVRLVLNGETNYLDLYITKTSEISQTGHQLRYTSVAPVTVSGFEGFRFIVLGSASDPTKITLHTIRLASSLLIPNKRPVAICTDETGKIGQAILLDARSSYDPENKPVTYKWSVTQKPAGSAVSENDFRATHNTQLPGKEDAAPSFIPDKEGVYKIELTVNDGDLDSLPLEISVTVTESYLSRGHTPDASPLLRIISDLYQSLPDVNTLLTFWSAVEQIVAADLTIALQYDRDKSIQKTGRRVQRRWLNYPLKNNFSDSGQVFRLNSSPIEGTDGEVSAASPTIFTTTSSVNFKSAGVKTHSILKVEQEAFLVLAVWDDRLLVDRPITPGTGLSWEISPVRIDFSLSIDDLFIQPGDLAVFKIFNQTTLEETEETVEILGAVSQYVGTKLSSDLTAAFDDPITYTVILSHFYRTRKIPIDSRVVSIPWLQSVIKDPPPGDLLQQNVHYKLDVVQGQKFIELFTPITSNPPEDLWAETTYIDNSPTIEANFGEELGLYADDDLFVKNGIDYLSAVRGLLFVYLFGPTVENLKIGAHIFCGLPFAIESGTITEIDEEYSVEQGRITVLGDESGLERSYFYKKSLGLADNPKTGNPFLVGERVAKFAPLSKGVEIVDWLIDETWWRSQGLTEIEKYFYFQLGIDVDALPDLADLVSTVTKIVEHVKKTKPAYVDLLTVLQKNLWEEISVQDSVSFVLSPFQFIEKICQDSRVGLFGEKKGDGTPTWVFGAGLSFGYSSRICPREEMTIEVCEMNTNQVRFGSVFAFGDTVLAFGATIPTQNYCRTAWTSLAPAPGMGPLKGT